MLTEGNGSWFGRAWAKLLGTFRLQRIAEPDEISDNPLGLADCPACKGVRCVQPPEPYTPDADGYVTTRLRSTWCTRCFATVTFDATGGAPVRPPPEVDWHDKCDECGGALELTDEIISIPGGGGFLKAMPPIPIFRFGWCPVCNDRRLARTRVGHVRRLAEQAREARQARARGQLD